MIDPYDYNEPEDDEYDCLDRDEDLVTDDDENEESEDETIRLAINHRKRNH
jgi:hypothetical protein